MQETDQAAVARALAGDRDGFRVLVERYSRAIFGLAYRITGNEDDAEDVVQETFLRAYRNLASYDDRAAFSTWLYRIAANHTIDSFSRKKRVRPRPFAVGGSGELLEEPAATDPGPERLLWSAELRQRIADAMEGLTPRERIAFTMRHHEQCSSEEVGAALGLRPAAARHTIFRAVQKLRRALAPLVGVEA